MSKILALTAAFTLCATTAIAGPTKKPSPIAKQLAALDAKADSLRTKLGTVQGMIDQIEKPFADGVAVLKGKEQELKDRAAVLQQDFDTRISPDLDRYHIQCCRPSCEAAQDSSTTALTQDEARTCNDWSEREFLPYAQAAKQVVDEDNAREQAMADLQTQWAAVEASDDYQALIAKRRQLWTQLSATLDKFLHKCAPYSDPNGYIGRMCFDGAQEGLPDGANLQPAGTRFFGN